jgi:hypothetical protein
MTTKALMLEWAATNGFTDAELGYCILQNFDHAYGRLPYTLAGLSTWALANNMRTPDGLWRCDASSLPEGASWLNSWQTGVSDVRAYIYQHPWESTAVAALVYTLLMNVGRVGPQPKHSGLMLGPVKELRY